MMGNEADEIPDWSRLAPLEAAGTAILTLAEGLEEAELLRSRLTRAEVTRQILLLVAAAESLPEATRAALPEIDWAAWSTTARQLQAEDPGADSALWFAVSAQVPTTMLWLRVHQQAS